MNRTARVALIFGGLVFGLTAPALAQTASTNLSVTATVAKNCSITTTAVAFGSYDPIVANAATPLDGTGSRGGDLHEGRGHAHRPRASAATRRPACGACWAAPTC